VDLRKSFVVLTAYRLLFFAIQSILFYVLYKNKLDAFLYQDILTELVRGFKKYPSDILLFLQGKYLHLHVSEELKTYLYSEVRVAFFMKTLLPIFLISAGNYYLMGAWLTLLGSLCFTAFLSMYKKTDNFYVWFVVLIIPSFNIWTVGILKEALVIPILFLLFYLLQKIINLKGKDLFSTVVFIVLLLLVWYVKYYLAAVFIMICVFYMMHVYVRLSLASALISTFLLVCVLFGLGYLHPALKWDVFPEVIYIGYNLTCTKFIESTPCIPFDLDMTWTSILMNFPKAFVYAFLSPFPWQIHNLASLLAAIESYVFLVLVALMFVRWFRKQTSVSGIEQISLLIIFIAGSLLILASPNIGSFSRYRIFYLPIYAYIVFQHSGLIYSRLITILKKIFI